VQPDNSSGTLYAYEVCDACEADGFGYDIDGITVSDFVFPAWFESFRQPSSTQFDFQKQIQQPLQLLPGGYIGVFDVTSGTGWHQVTADKTFRYDMRPRLGSRRERRRPPGSNGCAQPWQRKLATLVAARRDVHDTSVISSSALANSGGNISRMIRNAARDNILDRHRPGLNGCPRYGK
jgi:hypothetical protein